MMTRDTYPIILASASPRRKTILEKAGIPCKVCPVEIEENFKGKDPVENAERIAYLKVKKAVERFGPSHIIIGADTFIVFDSRLLGKASDKEEARRMITEIAGASHLVYTGFCVYDPAEELYHRGVESTVISFSPMSPSEIDDYIETGEWEDAAGAYKIQGIASRFVTGIEGSYHNVMGLPIHRIYGILMQIHYL